MLKDSKKETMKILDSYTGPVFSDKIGKIKMEPVHLQYEPGFKAIQPHLYGVPYHYQDRLATHLHKLTSASQPACTRRTMLETGFPWTMSAEQYLPQNKDGKAR